MWRGFAERQLCAAPGWSLGLDGGSGRSTIHMNLVVYIHFNARNPAAMYQYLTHNLRYVVSPRLPFKLCLCIYPCAYMYDALSLAWMWVTIRSLHWRDSLLVQTNAVMFSELEPKNAA